MSTGATQATALVLLPVAYIPDERGVRRPVEDTKFEMTMVEIASRFGGGTLFRISDGNPKGYWWDRGFVDEDVLAILEVDLTDIEESIAWLRQYTRHVLLRRFEQKAIYLRIIGPVRDPRGTGRNGHGITRLPVMTPPSGLGRHRRCNHASSEEARIPHNALCGRRSEPA